MGCCNLALWTAGGQEVSFPVPCIGPSEFQRKPRRARPCWHPCQERDSEWGVSLLFNFSSHPLIALGMWKYEVLGGSDRWRGYHQHHTPGSTAPGHRNDCFVFCWWRHCGSEWTLQKAFEKCVLWPNCLSLGKNHKQSFWDLTMDIFSLALLPGCFSNPL